MVISYLIAITVRCDIRELQKRGVLDKPITGPAEVSPKDGGKAGSTFYGDS